MKSIVILGIILAIISSLTIALAEDRISYPAGADTDEKKVEWLIEAKEGLRAWHNEQTAGMSKGEARAFFEDVFFSKSAEIEREINRYQVYGRDVDGSYIKNVPACPEIRKWNPNISNLLNTQSAEPAKEKKGD